MQVIDIVRAYLDGLFNGLVRPDLDCSCTLDDLQPCGWDFAQCEPGYRGVSADDPQHWAIYRTKEDALASIAPAGRRGA